MTSVQDIVEADGAWTPEALWLALMRLLLLVSS
jgi:hypothetical protein